MHNVSAVIGLFFDKNNNILAIQNKRGIDVPGGHCEVGEDYRTCLVREAREEAGANINNIRMIGQVTSQTGGYKNQSMLFATGDVISFDKRKAEFISIDDFLSKYSQEKIIMKKMISRGSNLYERKRD